MVNALIDMFTSSCLIRKNTKELRGKLLEIGLEYKGRDAHVGSPWLFVNRGVFYEIYPSRPARHYEIVDCKENERLFLAIASIQDRADTNQWMVNIDTNEWYYSLEDYCYKRFLPCRWNKANIQQLKEHFKE